MNRNIYDNPKFQAVVLSLDASFYTSAAIPCDGLLKVDVAQHDCCWHTKKTIVFDRISMNRDQKRVVWERPLMSVATLVSKQN